MPDLISNLALGFSVALSLSTFAYCMAGVTIGTFIGVLPGIGALAGISMLLPMTFYLEPLNALVMLSGIYYGTQYGSSTASILLNMPGSGASAVTCLDGYPMARKGRAGVALLMTTLASFFGSIFGIVLLAAVAPVIAAFALSFGSPEYFSLVVLGLLAACMIARNSPLRAIVMVVFGLVLGITGTDVISGQYRFVFGIFELADGLNLVAIALGLFGVAELLGSIRHRAGSAGVISNVSWRSMIPTRDDLRRSRWAAVRGASIGSALGALPGAGPAISSFMSYAVETRVTDDKSRFGEGAIEGIVAPEAANNAASQTSFAPTLTLGIPGDPIMALMLGAMMIHGITPGPDLIEEQAAMFWGLVASFFLGNLLLLILNIPLIGLWIKMLSVPHKYLYPSILTFICIGVFSVDNSVFDVMLVLIFGLLGYLMKAFNFEPAPLILGFILGPMMEENLRRSLLLSRGDLTIFLERPYSALFLTFSVLILVWMFIGEYRARRRRLPSR